jgi:hypothetical protein
MKKIQYLLLSLIALGALSSPLFAGNVSIRELLGMHIDIGLGKSLVQNANAQTFPDILSTQQALKKQVAYDLVGALDAGMNEQARTLTLTKYLSDTHQLLQTTQRFLDQEDLLITQYTTKVKDCETPLKQANADFAVAVQSYNLSSAQKISQEIAKLRACSAENGVYYKEHLAYKNATLALQTSLQKKRDYVATNQEKMVKYYDLLKPQLLKVLYDLSRVLEVNYAG